MSSPSSAEPSSSLPSTESDAEVRRRDLRQIVWEGSLANIFIVLTGGAFITGMALALGASDFEIGLLTALPYLAQSAQLLAPWFGERLGSRKKITLWGLLVGRQIWWLVIPLLFLGGGWRLSVFLILVALSALATTAVVPTWLAWVSDIVPERIRGRFFGARNAAIAISTLVSSILGSLALDWLRAAGREALGFAVLIGAAALAAVLAARSLFLVHDTEPSRALAVRSLGDLIKPLTDRSFRSLLRVFCAWNFAIGLSAPFFAPQMLLNLRMSFFLIGLYSSGTSLIAIALNRPWGAAIDRFGSKSVLTLCAAGIGLVPLIWLFPRADFLWLLIFEGIYSGALWAGFTLAAFTAPIDESPRRERALYLAWFAVVTGLAFFTASLIGGLAAEAMAGLALQVGPQTIVNYHVIFVLSAVLRLAAAGLMVAFKEPAQVGLPVMVQMMGYAVLKRMPLGRQILSLDANGNGGPGRTKPEQESGPGGLAH